MSQQILEIDTVPEAEKLAVAQFLALASSANVFFELIHDRLVVRAVNPRWEHWRAVRRYLDEIGTDAVADYFRHTTVDEREHLSAPA